MAKRRANVDSDDENPSVNDTPPSKRARTADSDDERAPPASSRRAKGKGKARRKDDDDDEDEEDESGSENGADGDEDRKFEEENEETVRAALEAGRKVHGGIADHGIIEGIEMHQFMCHKFLTFSFGPQINFIIGHNGSGKSAVLSAITVALGGKANSTGRGNGLKSFIREGQAASEVTISIKNQGEEAFKPKEYGKSIVITRRFTKEGNSSWKIKSKDGKVISTKKDELAAICDHMNIQVDNPMNVLTQDAARQFLSASAPGDKYKFFLRGTQLSQLSEEYDTCFANITATTKVLAQKKEAIPDLRTAFREASTRFEEASKAREQKKKVDELKKELAWAHVNAKKKEMESKIEDAAKMARRLPKIESSIVEAEIALAAADEVVVAVEQEFDAIGDKTALQAQKDSISEQIREKKSDIVTYHNELKEMNVQMRETKASIEEYEAAIAKENKRLEKDSESKRLETQAKLTSARDAIATAEAALIAIQAQQVSNAEDLKRLKDMGMAAESRRNDLRAEITNCDGAINNCRKANQDRYAAYGQNIQKVVERINQTQWYGEKPLGPLGIYVTVRDHKWADLLRIQLGQLLSSYAVTNPQDIATLKKILVQEGNQRTQIHFFQPDLFDYSSGEPSADVFTVLRALEVSDPHVLRIMINKAGIEARVLAAKRADAARILANMRAGMGWTLDMFMVTRYPEGGESSIPINSQHRPHPMLLVGSATSELERWREKKAAFEAELMAADAPVREAQAQWNVARATQDSLKKQEAAAAHTAHRAKMFVNELQEAINEDLPVELTSFQDALEEAQRAKDLMLEQFKEVSALKAGLDEEQKALVAKREKFTQEINEFTARKHAAKGKMDKAVDKRTEIAGQIHFYKKKLEEEQEKVTAAEEVATTVSQEFTEWTTKAEEYCERVETTRSVDTVDRALRSTQAALSERERRHGATVEDMTIEVNKAKEKLEKAENDLKQMTSLNKALKASLIVRLSRWQEFRRHIALRCKLVFGYHLSQRGYYGKVMFDHEKQTLQLKVQTDDQAATQGGRDKDPRSLSGGEKSFSTICLLLSLWESIGCPLRCLDEFDVFMDAVNRRISMKMMIDTANRSDKKQYVLITPQDMNNVAPGPTVRVHRMTDPERGQAQLGFAN
ncbi:P-loop containing nucleoside triphosphate hydrolase protein [Mycena belliarum]|uniref:P-loop containing nucleoside triphosphate hydrolase protein n=1 Tax=Mycena belliarum TaxID=1033014 RepID=A0AAD6UAF1_9AGAR|nr:P-loop containing nucleoside triphosphate hydrolase protein [Mycena belliae]